MKKKQNNRQNKMKHYRELLNTKINAKIPLKFFVFNFISKSPESDLGV